MTESFNEETNYEKYLINLANVNSSIGKLEALNIYIQEKYASDKVLSTILGEAIEELVDLSGMKDKRAKRIALNKPKNNITADTLQKARDLRDIRLNKVTQPKPVAKVEKVYAINPNFAEPYIILDVKNSSYVKSSKYFTYTKTLAVTFVRNDKEFNFLQVPKDEILELVNSDSFGSYLKRNIETKYKFEEVTENIGSKVQ